MVNSIRRNKNFALLTSIVKLLNNEARVETYEKDEKLISYRTHYRLNGKYTKNQIQKAVNESNHRLKSTSQSFRFGELIDNTPRSTNELMLVHPDNFSHHVSGIEHLEGGLIYNITVSTRYPSGEILFNLLKDKKTKDLVTFIPRIISNNDPKSTITIITVDAFVTHLTSDDLINVRNIQPNYKGTL